MTGVTSGLCSITQIAMTARDTVRAVRFTATCWAFSSCFEDGEGNTLALMSEPKI